MKSIKQEIENYGTGRLLPSDFGSFLEMTTEKLEPIKPNYDIREEYICRVQIGVKYSCNEAEKERATKQAESHLMHTLYNEQLSMLNDLRSALYSEDKKKMLKLINEMQDSMRI